MMYVVVVHGTSDDPEIVGPFETFEEADAWGKAFLDPENAAWYVQRVIAPEQAEV